VRERELQMGQTIDCLIIGHNEMQFDEYERIVRLMGAESEAYQDLNLNFIRINSQPITCLEVYNLFTKTGLGSKQLLEPLSLSSLFSATIAYLSTYLSRRGLTFDYIRSFQAEKEGLAKKLLENRVFTIAITTTLYVSMFPIVEIVSFIRKFNKNVKIIVGGPFFATNVRIMDKLSLNYLLNCINADFFVNSSQGEATLVKLINALKNNTSISEVNNLYYQLNGQYIATSNKIENNQLSANIVDWSLFKDRIGQFAAVRTAVSCPYSCAFCGFPQHAGKYQTTEVEVIEREFDTLEQTGKVKSIYIIDDTFNVPMHRFKDILRMMIRNKYSFKWHSYFRCQHADEEMVEMMRESGCEGVFLGIESGNQQILENMNKSVLVDQYIKGLSLLKKYGIITFASFIIGFPGETTDTVQDTIDFIEESQPDFYRAQLWYCEKITPIWGQRAKYNLQGSQFTWSHQTMNSKIACEKVKQVFLTIRNSIWLPQYNFDFDNIFQLLYRGMSLSQVKKFILSFNQGIKEKIMDPKQLGVRPQTIEKIKKSISL
jgi:anaerobic magnesium-protoporphyrin IX monomethyl ester cyclase